MKFDISIIEERIKELGSKEKVLEYLNRLLFDWKKRKIEFGAYDKTELKRLKEITKDDYKAYKNEFDNDRLVYFDNGKSEKAIAERVGIKNLELLKKRLRLEFHKEDIDAKISLIKGLIKREQEKSIPNKSDFTKDKLDSLIITLTALKGYEKPSTYLNEMLERVRLLNDTDFEFNFFLNVFHSCKDNAEKFWSEGHKKDISEWFSKCPYPAHLIKKNEMVNLFDTLWDNTPPPDSKPESRTKQVITDTLVNIDKQGWQYAFTNENDYNSFTDLLTNFFEYKDYTLPKETIKLKKSCKTKVARALGEIHKELSNENILRTDTDFFRLIRVLSHFEKETEGNLYKALTR